MADDDKGRLNRSDPVPPDLVTKMAPFVVASEQKRFAKYLGIIGEPKDQQLGIMKAESQVNIIGEGKKQTVSNELE